MGFMGFIFGKSKDSGPDKKAAAEALAASAMKHLDDEIKRLEEQNNQTRAQMDILKTEAKLASNRAKEAGEEAIKAGEEVKFWEGVQANIENIEKDREKNKVLADQKIKGAEGPLKEWIQKYQDTPPRELRILLEPKKNLGQDQLEAVRLVLMSRKEPPLPIDPKAEAIESMMRPMNRFEELLDQYIAMLVRKSKSPKMSTQDLEIVNQWEVVIPDCSIIEQGNGSQKLELSMPDKSKIEVFSCMERIIGSKVMERLNKDTPFVKLKFGTIVKGFLFNSGISIHVNPGTLFSKELSLR